MMYDGDGLPSEFYKRVVPASSKRPPEGFVYVSISNEEYQLLRRFEIKQAEEAARNEKIVQKNGLDLISLAIIRSGENGMDVTPGSGGTNSLYSSIVGHHHEDGDGYVMGNDLSQAFGFRERNFSGASLSPLTTSIPSTPTDFSPKSNSRSRAASLDGATPLSKSKSMEL